MIELNHCPKCKEFPEMRAEFEKNSETLWIWVECPSCGFKINPYPTDLYDIPKGIFKIETRWNDIE